MSKWILIIMACIAILYGRFHVLNKYIYTEKQGQPMENTQVSADSTQITVTPISHASMVLEIGGVVIFNDPVGGKELFDGQPEASIILLSDIHGDHLDPETIQALATDRTVIVAPQSVADQLPTTLPGTLVILNNEENTTQNGIQITAIPMYNVPESADALHTKGRGNGYLLEAQGKRVYIAGDTGGTPEMRALQNIDVAFIPMNLPYTMGVEEAADAVLEFKPKVVHPYHYRGPDGLADINRFKELVNNSDSNITVELLNFYPEQ